MRCPNCEQQTLDHAPDGYWCSNCGDVDPADVGSAHFERGHYVWFDEDDELHLGEGWGGFSSNAIQLSEVEN